MKLFRIKYDTQILPSVMPLQSPAYIQGDSEFDALDRFVSIWKERKYKHTPNNIDVKYICDVEQIIK